jgi:hypothetical protein
LARFFLILELGLRPRPLLHFLLLLVVVYPSWVRPGPIHRSYDGIPLHQVLYDLALLSGREVVIGADVRGLVFSTLSGVEPGRAFDDIARAHGLVVRTLFVHDRSRTGSAGSDRGLLLVGARRALADDPLVPVDRLAPRFRSLRLSLDVAGIHLPDLLTLLRSEVELTWIVRPVVGTRLVEAFPFPGL